MRVRDGGFRPPLQPLGERPRRADDRTADPRDAIELGAMGLHAAAPLRFGALVRPPVPASLIEVARMRPPAPASLLEVIAAPPTPRAVGADASSARRGPSQQTWGRFAALASVALAAGIAAVVLTSTPAAAPGTAPPPATAVTAGARGADPALTPHAVAGRAGATASAVHVPLPPRRPVVTPPPATTPTSASPPRAQAQSLASEGKTVDAQAARVAQLSSSLGISPTLLARGDDRLLSSLEKLPPDVRQMYRSLSGPHKQLIASKLEGSTQVLFVTVNHRDAFISGSAAGRNTFDVLQQKLQEARDGGKLEASTATGLSKALEAFRHMTTAQRAAVVGLLEKDVARGR